MPEQVNDMCVPAEQGGEGQNPCFALTGLFPGRPHGSAPLSARPPFSLPSFFITERLGLQGSQPATGPLSMEGMMQAGARMVSK